MPGPDRLMLWECCVSLLAPKTMRRRYCKQKLDGCIVRNAHNTVLGEEALLIHIVTVGNAT